MANFAFIVPPLMGHINPTLSLGAGLLERGHEVAWIGVDQDNIAGRLPRGGRFLEIPTIMNDENEKAIEQVKNSLQSGIVHGIESLKYFYEHAMTPLNEYMLDKIMKVLDDNPVDMIIADQHLLSGAVAAVLKNIPYVTSVSTPAAINTNEILPQFSNLEREHIIRFQQKAGIAGDERLDTSRLMCLVYTSKLFFGDYFAPEHFKFIGPVINPKRDKIDFDWDLLSGQGNRPRILVSVGTTFAPQANRPFFTKAAEALGGEDYTVIAISDEDNFETIPPNFIVRQRVPQLELLPHVDLVICHGGFNTVSEALYNGKPLVVLPKAYDQSYVASKIIESGTGIRLNSSRFRAYQLKEAVSEVLGDNSYRQNAEKISRSFTEAGGIRKGAELLENLLL